MILTFLSENGDDLTMPEKIIDIGVFTLAGGAHLGTYYLDEGYHSHTRLWGSGGWIEYAEWLGKDRPPKRLTWHSHAEGHQTDGIETYEGPLEPRGYTPWWREWVRAAVGLTEPPITGAEGLRVLRTVFGAYEAAEAGHVGKLKWSFSNELQNAKK